MIETREVSGFSAVEIHGVGEVFITQGDGESLTIESDDHILPLIESEVTGGTLSLGPKRGSRIRDVKRLVYRLTVTDLESITHDGEGVTIVTGLDVDSLTVTLRGAGDFTISGAARSQTINLQGASAYNSRDFATAQASVNLQGAGDITVQVSDALSINISGVGNVTYYGDPAITRRIAGVGVIKQGR